MMHVVKADIAGKPLEQARQAKIGSAFERGRDKTPACVRNPLRMLKAVQLKPLPAIDRSCRQPLLVVVLRRGQVPALIAVFESAGTAVSLQRDTEMIRPDRHPEFS